MFKRKLFLNYLTLIIVSLILSGFIISRSTIRIYKNQAEEELRSNTAMAAFFLEQHDTADFDEFATSLSQKMNSYLNEGHSIRITVISQNGFVLGDSDAEINQMDNHLKRPEIIEASLEGSGLSTRKSDTTSVEYMYFATKLPSGDFLRLSLPLSHIRSLTGTIYIYTLIGIVAALLFAVFMGYRFSKHFTEPVALLSIHTDEISKGNLSHRIPHEPRRDELSILIDSFNKMTDDLEKSFIRLSDRNHELDTLINAINDGIIAVDSNDKILFANDRLKALPGFEMVENGCDLSLVKNSDVLKVIEKTIKTTSSMELEIKRHDTIILCFSSYFELHSGPCAVVTLQDITKMKRLESIRYDFVSNVTHELNTPLTSIQGFIETLRSGAVNDTETAMKFLNIIEIESERLQNLINDILTLSSIENESTEAAKEKVNIREISEEALTLLENNITEKQIKVINEIDPLSDIDSNRDRLKQLFINLIDNAVKYNVESGEIRLYTAKKSGILEIHVRDTGIGIDEKHKERLFERFYRVDKGRSRKMGGTGLGLSIVKHIAMLYNGSVSVSSEPGEGSDFCVSFPL